MGLQLIRRDLNNLNYPVSVHYTFIYSTFHCLHLVITLFVIKGHAGMEPIPDKLLIHCSIPADDINIMRFT